MAIKLKLVIGFKHPQTLARGGFGVITHIYTFLQYDKNLTGLRLYGTFFRSLSVFTEK